MIIKQIYIDNFGKLQDFQLDLNDGFNVIYGKNEDGKSTLMNFIRLVFYGDKSRSQNIREKPRALYRPWNNSLMKGYIVFSVADKNYRIERTFGRSNASDEIALWDLDRNQLVSLPRMQEPGEFLFALGGEAFEKSIYISQSGSFISSDGKKEDEINQKLTNMVTSGDEDVSFDSVKHKLASTRESLVSRSKSKGSLVMAQQALAALQEKRTQAEQDEAEKAVAAREITEKRSRQAGLEQEMQSCQQRLALAKLYKRKREISRRLDSYRELTRLQDNVRQTELDLRREDVSLDDAFVDQAQSLLASLQESKQLLAEQEAELLSADSKLNRLRAEKPREISEDVFSKLEEYKEKEQRLAARKSRLQLDGRALQGLAQVAEDLEKLEDKLAQILELNEASSTKLAPLQNEEGKLFAAKNKLEANLEAARRELEQKTIELAALQLQLSEAAAELKSMQEQTRFKLEYAAKELERAKSQEAELAARTQSAAYQQPLFISSLIFLLAVVISGVFVSPWLLLLLLAPLALLLLAIKKATAQKQQAANSKQEEMAKLQADYDQQKARAEADLLLLEEKKRVLEEEITQIQPAQVLLLAQVENMESDYTQQITEPGQLLAGEIQALKLEQRDYALRIATLEEQIVAQKERLQKTQANFNLTALPELLVSQQTAGQVLAQLEAEELTLQESIRLNKEEQQNLLLSYGAVDEGKLKELGKGWSSYLQQVATSQALHQEKAASLRQLKDKTKELEDKIIALVMLYQPVANLEQASARIQELVGTLSTLQKTKIKLKASRENLEKNYEQLTQAELEEMQEQIEAEIIELTGLTKPLAAAFEPLDDTLSFNDNDRTPIEDQASLEEEIAKFREQIDQLASEIVYQEATIREKFSRKDNVSQLDEKIELTKEDIERLTIDHRSLQIAEAVLEEAFTEVQKNFGPLLNNRTAEIFSKLTGGRYANVRVARQLDISVENPQDNILHSWGFLSSGTIEQVYLSLRLAISDLTSQDKVALPLLLDDIFTLYDDNRAREGMNLLDDFRRGKDRTRQILLFTCHQRIVDLGRGIEAEVKIL